MSLVHKAVSDEANSFKKLSILETIAYPSVSAFFLNKFPAIAGQTHGAPNEMPTKLTSC